MGTLDVPEKFGNRTSSTATCGAVNSVKGRRQSIDPSSCKETPSFAMATVSSLLRQGVQISNRPSMKPRKAYRGGDAKKLEESRITNRRVPQRAVSNPVTHGLYFTNRNYARALTGSKSTVNKATRGAASNSSTASTYDGSQFFQEDPRRYISKDSYWETTAPYVSSPTSGSSCLSTPAAFRVSAGRLRQSQSFLPRVAESPPVINKMLQLSIPTSVQILSSPPSKASAVDESFLKHMTFPDSTICDADKSFTSPSGTNRPITIVTQSCQVTGVLGPNPNSPILFKFQNEGGGTTASQGNYSYKQNQHQQQQNQHQQQQNQHQQQQFLSPISKVFPTENVNNSALHKGDLLLISSDKSHKKIQSNGLERSPKVNSRKKSPRLSVNNDYFDIDESTHTPNQFSKRRNKIKLSAEKEVLLRQQRVVSDGSARNSFSSSFASSNSPPLIAIKPLKRKRPIFKECSSSSVSSLTSSKSRWKRVADNKLDRNHFSKLSRGSGSLYKFNDSSSLRINRENKFAPTSLAWKYIDLFKSFGSTQKKALEIDKVQALFETTAKPPSRKVRVHTVSITKTPQVTSFAKRVTTSRKTSAPVKSSCPSAKTNSDPLLPRQLSSESNRKRKLTILRIVPSSSVTIKKELSLRQRFYHSLKTKFLKTYVLWKYTAYRIQFEKLK